MERNVLFTLLHDVWGDESNESLRLTIMRLGGDEIALASVKELSQHIPEIPVQKWQSWVEYYSLARYQARKELLEQLGVKVILYGDDDYPPKLFSVYKPPSILYVKGTLSASSLCIAFVGSRKATSYGKNVAYSLAKSLSNENITIISGLAKGIDANSHKGALEGSAGTIAVLGCGIDKIYPRENAKLYDEILEHPNSAIISEWSLGSAAINWHFPQRNRVIAGLCDGLVVVEAAKKSGSLITAGYALEYGKDVFAVPGLITSPESVGCHRLLKDGAKLVTQPIDIIEEYKQIQLFKEEKVEAKKRVFSDEQESVYDVLTGVPQSVEEICLLAKLPIHVVSGILLEFELDEIVVQDYGRRYSKIEN